MKDHAQLGRELDLFHHSPLVGKGLPLLTPRGTTVLRVLKRFVEDEELRRGYEYTATPFMADEDLYKVSGHWELYQDNMFLIPDTENKGHSLALRPMTCPFQFQLYLRRAHSYRDLPVRYAETSSLFRNEASGALHGLIRTRQFTLSEGHIICTPEQVPEEFMAALELVRFVTGKIGLDGYWYRFSIRGDEAGGKYIDNPAAWEKSQALLRQLLVLNGEPFVEAPGEAAFYGPKLDIQYKDSWGREETLFTLQLDFALPERFGMSYTGADGAEHHPMVIHRSSIGCYERTLALLLEKYQGELPFWLAPEQLRILSVGENHGESAEALRQKLAESGLRCAADKRDETLGRKIQDARVLKIPLLVILGDQEASSGSISLRLAGSRDTLQADEQKFIDWIAAANRQKSLKLEPAALLD